MLQTEYLRNLNSNYERILLDKKPEENRYQYCILSRGGIRGLLPCSLRYINGLAYLYYDITSKQNVAQLFSVRCITRAWLKDFFWSMQQIQQELERFLLDSGNILWYPEQIFQDLENNVFYFLYMPYYEGESNFGKFLDFLVDHIDYDDEVLVDCVYHMYEQMERSGEAYLQAQIYEDSRVLEKAAPPLGGEMVEEIEKDSEEPMQPVFRETDTQGDTEDDLQEERREEKKKLFSFFEGKRRRAKEQREAYRLDMHRALDGYTVAEELDFDQEYGQTIYIEEKAGDLEPAHRLYTAEDRLVASLEKAVHTIGKKREEADIVLADSSVSRLHARITKEGKEFYLEDLNSTNGTFKNGLRLQPYEKRKLEKGDELKCGRVVLIFR